MDFENYPTELDWLPVAKGQTDLLAVGFADGSFQLITKFGKVEKTVSEAHKKAVESNARSPF